MSGPGRPGPVGKGPRTAKTVRFPDDLYELLAAEAQAAGYGENFSEFVVKEMAERRRARLVAMHRGRLPLGA